VLRGDFLGVKHKALSHGRARSANNHIKQNHAILFADDTVGLTDYCFIAMAANDIHASRYGNANAMTGSRTVCYRRHLKSIDVKQCP
jgi:hypothetical protein